MATAYETIDALGLYLTGAASDGAAQADPAAALGGYRSSSEVAQLGARISNPLPGVVVDLVHGANGTGSGTIRGDTSGNLYWTPPGGSEGSAVAITNGQTKLLLDSGATKAVRVSRVSTAGISGTMDLELVPVFYNLPGLDDVANAERVAGFDSYRCMMLKHNGTEDLHSVRVWASEAGCQSTVYLAAETPVADAVQTIANDTTAPTGLSWVNATGEGSALECGSMTAGDMLGVWLKRTFPAAGTVAEREYITLHWSYSIED